MNAQELDRNAERVKLSELDASSILYKIASTRLRFASEYKAMRDGKPIIVTK